MKRFIIFSLLTSFSAGLVTYLKDQPDQSGKSEIPKSRSVQIEDIIRLKPAKNAHASNTELFSVSESDSKALTVVAVPFERNEILQQSKAPQESTLPERKLEETPIVKGAEQPVSPENTLRAETVVANLKAAKRKIMVQESKKIEQSEVEQPKHMIPTTALRRSLSDLEAIAKQDPRAAFDLGLRYFRGDGVRQDSYQALQWMRDAAERGDISAQKAVGRLYMTGLEEMGADFQEANKWLTIAAGRGDKEAAALLLEASEARKDESQYRISTDSFWYRSYPYKLYWYKGTWNYY